MRGPSVKSNNKLPVRKRDGPTIKRTVRLEFVVNLFTRSSHREPFTLSVMEILHVT
jgi:hypothetical protein